MKYHIVKITTTNDNQIVATKVLTPRPLLLRSALRLALRNIAHYMKWDRDPTIPDFIKNINLDTRPSQIDLDELQAVNWEPRFLIPESQLRWAVWKLQEDKRFTVPGHEPDDDYGIQTYTLAPVYGRDL